MYIGRVELRGRVVAAPMAGITDRAYRMLAREAHCALTCTEMLSARALCLAHPRTLRMADLSGEEPPVSAQIFGREPGEMARAARLVVERGAALVDLNMGCPTPKIVRNGEGAALMRDLPLALEIVEAVAEAVQAPVTVKIRRGWEVGRETAVELAAGAERAGAAAVTVHGRFRDQFYHGQADWGVIRRVREAVGIPVIGNGDVKSPEQAAMMLEETGCAAVMIGRGALGNPWLYRQVHYYLQEGRLLSPPEPRERIEMALRHLGLMVCFKGEATGVREMRKQLVWYLKGLPGAARLRERLQRVETARQAEELLSHLAEDPRSAEPQGSPGF